MKISLDQLKRIIKEEIKDKYAHREEHGLTATDPDADDPEWRKGDFDLWMSETGLTFDIEENPKNVLYRLLNANQQEKALTDFDIKETIYDLLRKWFENTNGDYI
jgi:hypothetical protein